MQTFLPLPSFMKSAKTLDNARLGKQRVECLQIIGALTGQRIVNSTRTEFTGRYRMVPLLDGDGEQMYDSDDSPVLNREAIYRKVDVPADEWELGPNNSSWRNHPAVLMWQGYEPALLKYSLTICKVWTDKGYRDTCAPKMRFLLWGLKASDINNAEMPSWFGKKKFHLSHQSNLIRKKPEHYLPLFPGVPDDLEYIWPKPSA